MSSENIYLLSAIGVIALITVAIRAIPFLLFGGKKELPDSIQYLAKLLPTAMIAILVIYCLKSVNLLSGSHGIPELLSVAVVALLHIWKKNTFLSIGAGTVCYMLLIQLVF